MMRLETLAALFPNLEAAEITTWIEQHWVEPEPAAGGVGDWVFHEIDVARVRLIYDLRYQLDVGEELVPMVLSLIDQVYELRCRLKAVTEAVNAQPPEIRSAVLAAIEAKDRPAGPTG
jgi:chaperone modulatory protein CbpM